MNNLERYGSDPIYPSDPSSNEPSLNKRLDIAEANIEFLMEQIRELKPYVMMAHGSLLRSGGASDKLEVEDIEDDWLEGPFCCC